MKLKMSLIWKRFFAACFFKSSSLQQKHMEQRAKRGSREKFERALSRVPDVEPEERDKL